MESLNQGISALLTDPRFSDLEIRCGGKIFNVHRAIVCASSRVLARECEGGFEEAAARTIKHTVFGPFTLDRMLQYIYRGDYVLSETFAAHVMDESCTNVCMSEYPSAFEVEAVSRISPGETTFPDPLLGHAHVWAIGDYYEVPGLKHLAAERFRTEAEARDTLAHSTLIDIATAVYECSSKESPGLRSQLCSLACTHSNASYDSSAFISAIAERDDLREFASDLMVEIVKWFRAQAKASIEAHEAVVVSYEADLSKSATELEANRDRMNRDIADAAFIRSKLTRAQDAQRLAESNSNFMKFLLDDANIAITRLKKFAEIEHCAGCGEPFRYTLVPYPNAEFRAKCRACGREHTKSSYPYLLAIPQVDSDMDAALNMRVNIL